MLKFALIGDGAIAKYHKKAIEHVGGEISYIFDPKHVAYANPLFEATHFPHYVDYAVICSPSNFHRSQIQEILKAGHILRGIICEKPAFLPWEMPIDSDLINIVLQLRYLPNLPEKADLVSVRFVRDEAYFKSWKGDARNTGGLFYSLFIHYLDLAIRLRADFEGMVSAHGHQERVLVPNLGIDTPCGFHFFPKQMDEGGRTYSGFDHCHPPLAGLYDLLKIDNQACYNKLYEEIIEGKGIKPKDLFYLNWILQRNSEIFGYGLNGLGKTIAIKNELM